MMVWKMIFLFQGCILRFHVNLSGCIYQVFPWGFLFFRIQTLGSDFGPVMMPRGSIFRGALSTMRPTRTNAKGDGNTMKYWVVVSNIFYFHPYLGEWSNLLIFFKWVETTNQNTFYLVATRAIGTPDSIKCPDRRTAYRSKASHGPKGP